MRRKTRAKVKRISIIAGIIIGVILLITGVFLIIRFSKKREISYDDSIVCKNYFTTITIDLEKKKVKRDSFNTSLTEEFEITKEQEDLALSSEEEIKKLFLNSTFEIEKKDNIITIKNPYQTKKIIVKASEIKEKVDGEEIIKLTDNLYILQFYSEKLTKAMYSYYKNSSYIEEIYFDDIWIDKPINDISQTMYGQTPVNLNNFHSLGVTSMGLHNYCNIINENSNPKDIVISTIGYGVNINNELFNERIDENYYNFILNNKEINETIPQGSRIAEVLVDSCTKNIKLMPLVTVTEEGYTSISSILQALLHGIKNSDVICYELINNDNKAIDILLEEAFKENIPVCVVSSSESKNYPANHSMTIAVASLDRENNIADYSGKGDYIDFAAPSTDIEEIFNLNSTISRWSGPEYSNAYIVSSIALIKTYAKDATILDIYNFLRNFCIDLGESGKDLNFGYGVPNFSNIKISDIDKESPTFKEVTIENQTWEVLKQVKIIAEDNIRIKSWALTKNEQIPNENEWKVLESVTPSLDVTSEITENGKYYIFVQDTAGNISKQEIAVDKIDNKPPQIAYTINKDTLNSGYVTIVVTAEDLESGLYDNPFSWDKRTWSKENSTRIVKQNGRYKVYAEDNLGNISELEILVDCFPQEGRYELQEGNIITKVNVSAEWEENTNKNVQITLNKDLNITAWQISKEDSIPQEFIEVEQITNQNDAQTNNNQTNSNINMPNNVVLENITTSNTTNENISNTSQNNTDNQVQIPRRTEPIVINKSLEVNTTYYLWVRDRDGNWTSQSFKIFKAEI